MTHCACLLSVLIYSQVVHKDFLPDRVFANYDDYYYYDDENEEQNHNRVKRQVRAKRCKSSTKCCRCLQKKGDLTIEEYRKYYDFFLQDNPNLVCPKSGHAAYR